MVFKIQCSRVHRTPPKERRPLFFDPSYRGLQIEQPSWLVEGSNTSAASGDWSSWNQEQSHGFHIGLMPVEGLLADGSRYEGRDYYGGMPSCTRPQAQPYLQFGAGYAHQGYQPQPPYHPSSHAQGGYSLSRYPRTAQFPVVSSGRNTGRPGAIRRPPAKHRPAQLVPRSRSAGFSASPPNRLLDDKDFPSLGSRPRSPVSREQVGLHPVDKRAASHRRGQQALLASHRRSGSHRSKHVPSTGFEDDKADGTCQQKTRIPPPPRPRRNTAFRLALTECYRGKIVYIDKLPGLDFGGHPAVVRSVDSISRKVRFFKKSSFKGIGGFFNKYREYVSKAQKRWLEKQWLLVDDGVTRPHHGTPLLRLAHGEKMPERGSYVDIHGDTELHIDYFSKYSRSGIFPDIHLSKGQMEVLETYSRWYLEKDVERKTAGRNKLAGQTDGSAEARPANLCR